MLISILFNLMQDKRAHIDKLVTIFKSFLVRGVAVGIVAVVIVLVVVLSLSYSILLRASVFI